MEIINKYFTSLSEKQLDQFLKLKELYVTWNSRINLISRKDIDNLYERHVLHSLALAKLVSFSKNSKILDVGTGGGFPGIPLAILYPEANFLLIDSILKKIKVVENVSSELGLKNIQSKQIRAEKLNGKFDYIVSRAVTSLPIFYKMIRKNLITVNSKVQNGGIYYLKGGDLSEEINALFIKSEEYQISDFFDENFFETKKIVFIPSKYAK
ncbi:MAG: 16S rRNA (guanine(527)-N(7))-methyltransferase RsmG [Bacteroidales bacterium]|nr:16S rRNA (guanine(527)-N(7))-methyltransferase RsmG [Bacteroidales bacterium]